MNNYQLFEWSEPETLNEEHKQTLIQRIRKNYRLGGIAIAALLLLIVSPFLLMLKNDMPHGNSLMLMIGCAVFSVAIFAFIMQTGEKKIEKLQTDDFVWRYGVVTIMRRGGKYSKARSEVDGQTVPYILGASVGDTVLVVGFNTAQTSKKLASFYAVPIDK